MATLAAVPETPAQNLSLEITRVIAAPIQRVFDAFTRPEVIRQWFGPPATVVPSVESNLTEGGAYAIHMQGTLPDSEAQFPFQSINSKAAVHGTYTRVSPFDLLQFTWIADWAPGETSLVTLHFRELDGGTELRLIQDRFASENSRDAHNHGWSAPLDKLATLLSN